MDIFNQVSSSLLDMMNEELQDKMNKAKKKRNIILLGIVLIDVVVSILIFDAKEYLFLIIPNFLTMMSVLITFLVTKMTVQGNLVNETLNPIIVDEYNRNNETNYEYAPKLKDKPTFNKEMGLFSRGASVSTKFKLSGVNSIPFEIRHTSMVVSNGQSSSVVFDGIYMMFQIKEDKFQIRKDGKPRLKGTRFARVKEEEYSTYTEEMKSEYVKDVYKKIYSILKKDFEFPKVYIGSNGTEIHVAYTTAIKTNFKNEITKEFFDEYQYLFNDIFKVLDRVVDLIRVVD